MAREDWRETLVVTHWGCIRGLTGYEAKNGEILRHEITQPDAQAVDPAT